MWDLFSSPTSKLPLEDVLDLVYKQLERAHKEKDPKMALQQSQNAKSLLKDAEKSFAKKQPEDPALKDSIAKAYHEHAKLLDELGYHDKAQKSYSKAETWGYIRTKNHQSDIPKADKANTLIPSTPSSLSGTTKTVASTHIQTLQKDIEQPSHRNPTHDPTPNTMSAPSKDITRIPTTIFEQNITPPIAKFALPEAFERIVSSDQLAYCLSLLHSSEVSKEGLDEVEISWSQAVENDPDEKIRLQTMATDMVRAFIREKSKMSDVVSEIVSLSAVLDQDCFINLLSELINGINRSVLLKDHLLDGLAHLIRNAVQGYVNADNLVKILEVLSTLLKNTHKQSTQNAYRLAQTISRVLDSMIDSRVEGLSREQLHEPLSAYLNKLQQSTDPYLVYQAAYASQAIIYISDDEPALKTALRRTGKVVQGISGMVSAVKALDLAGFVEGLVHIQESLDGVGKVIQMFEDAYTDVKKFTDNGQGLLQSLKECFKQKAAWYLALRGLDRLIQEGRFADFERLVREAPCRQDPAFQLGVCQRLGEIAVNTVWDVNDRKYAITFLGDIYKNDTTWGQHANVKQWVLGILQQLSKSSYGSLSDQAQILFTELKTDGSAEKQRLYQVYEKDHPEIYPIMVSLPPHGSRLLDCVQNKPDIETPLLHLKKERLEDRGEDVYISPRAKPNLRATEDFDLTSTVQEFLDSDKKVFLLLGDSGAGKSTFNRVLEIGLWKKYKNADSRIPLFIYLPDIDRPDIDMIDKHLRKANFTTTQIRELKRREFVVICDGYDECQETRNLYSSNGFNRPGGWRVQLVISCRTEYIGADYRDSFRQLDRNASGNSKSFQEAVITPFNKDQIQAYIEQYLTLMKPPWRLEDYQQAFKQVPNLQDLVKNPFLLKLALRVLPELLSIKSDFSKAHITRVKLYDEFIAQWIDRSKIRLQEVQLNSRDTKTYRALLDSGFKENSIAYLKELVEAIYEHQDGAPMVSYLEHRDQKTWKVSIFNDQDGRNLLREAIPLTRNGDQYRFIHKSVLEYGLALAVFDPSEHTEDTKQEPTTTRRASVGSVMSFEVQDSMEQTSDIMEQTSNTMEQSLLDSPLGRRNLVGDFSVLLFLTERAQEHPLFKGQLLSLIERSKVDRNVRLAATNAITILVRAGVQFNGADLRGIQVPGADISYGVFDSAQLEEVDLRKANLRGIWLRQANLNGARMTEVQFGELPSLLEESDVRFSSYSPDGNLYAVGTKNGEISLYETSSWTKIRSLVGHRKGLWHLVFSATSNEIASGSEDYEVRVWDANTGDCIQTLKGHIGLAAVVAYSPKGDQVASGSWDKTMRVWRVDSGKCVHIIQHKGDVGSLVYSPSGDRIASGCSDSTVRLWCPITGDCIRILQGHSRGISSVVYSLKGDRIASGGDKTVRLWDADTGECIHTFDHSGFVWGVAFSPTRDQIASSDDSAVMLWDSNTGNNIHTLKGHRGDIKCIMYSPNGNHIASGSFDNTIRLWDVDVGDCVHALQGYGPYSKSMAYSPNGKLIAFGSSGPKVMLWNANAIQPVLTLQGHSSVVTEVSASPKGDQIASRSNDGTIRLWDPDTGDCVHILQCPEHYFNCHVYSPKGDQIASGGDDMIIRLWDVDSGICLRTFQGHTYGVTCITYSPGGNQIASGSSTSVRIWDVDTGDCVHTLQSHTGSVNGVLYSPKGDRLTSDSEDGTVRLWDVSTGDCICVIEKEGMGTSVAHSSKVDQFAFGCLSGMVWLRSSNSGECVAKLQGHTNYVTQVTFSPRGDTVASGGQDNTLRLWDTNSGNCIYTLQGHADSIRSISFSPKGDLIASGCRGGTVRLWDVNTGRCLLCISDFSGWVNSITWRNASDGLYLVTGSHDKAVRCWQIITEGYEYKAVLRWGSSHEVLTVSDATFKSIDGLDQWNKELMRQRGASVEA